MLMNEVCKRVHLTKKAVEYYMEHHLIMPVVLENGYREFSEQDVDTLNQINVLRKLDISVDEIKSILNDPTNATLQSVAVRKELDYQRNEIKKQLLQELAEGKSYNQIKSKLTSLDQGKIIAEKILEAFPGYYGRFICLHFARFLNDSIQNENQQKAYDTIITFLDEVPEFAIPEELVDFINEATRDIGVKQIKEVFEYSEKAYADPETFFADNKKFIAEYLELKKSEEYQNSHACKLMNLMQHFNCSSGYYDIFIPAMKQLSPDYEKYCQQIEKANEKFLKQFPEIENFYEN